MSSVKKLKADERFVADNDARIKAGIEAEKAKAERPKAIKKAKKKAAELKLARKRSSERFDKEFERQLKLGLITVNPSAAKKAAEKAEKKAKKKAEKKAEKEKKAIEECPIFLVFRTIFPKSTTGAILRTMRKFLTDHSAIKKIINKFIFIKYGDLNKEEKNKKLKKIQLKTHPDKNKECSDIATEASKVINKMRSK